MKIEYRFFTTRNGAHQQVARCPRCHCPVDPRAIGRHLRNGHKTKVAQWPGATIGPPAQRMMLRLARYRYRLANSRSKLPDKGD
jgi:hypothetical protein